VDTRPPTPPEWDRPVTRPDDATADAERAACTFGRDALAGETLGPSTPIEGDIPIESIVVLVMENHSFDNYFSKLAEYTNRTDIEVAPPGATNPRTLDDAGADAGADAAPVLVPTQHAPHYCTLDTAHSWAKSHMEWDQGKMDGFVQANEDGPPLGDGARALYYWDQTDLPFYYQLASTFAIGDHYHAAVLGPTWPNRMYTYAATSFGRTTNDLPDISAYPFPDNDATILDELEKRHVSWKLYGTSGALTIYATNVLTRWGRKVNYFDSDFFADAKAGTLPQVAYLDTDAQTENAINPDEHPPADIQIGQKWVSDVVHALFTSPQWGKIALFLTYDEHGGYYDHLPPPPACAPDGIAPILKSGDTTQGGFDREGVRVPFIVVSPYAKKAYVSHKTYDHASIVRFIEAKFRVPALTARDANSDIPTDMFDFASPPFATPPDVPEPTVDPTGQSYCETTYPN
jgi:phospholipase C